jgi:hypothetical protein
VVRVRNIATRSTEKPTTETPSPQSFHGGNIQVPVRAPVVNHFAGCGDIKSNQPCLLNRLARYTPCARESNSLIADSNSWKEKGFCRKILGSQGSACAGMASRL